MISFDYQRLVRMFLSTLKDQDYCDGKGNIITLLLNIINIKTKMPFCLHYLILKSNNLKSNLKISFNKTSMQNQINVCNLQKLNSCSAIRILFQLHCPIQWILEILNQFNTVNSCLISSFNLQECCPWWGAMLNFLSNIITFFGLKFMMRWVMPDFFSRVASIR